MTRNRFDEWAAAFRTMLRRFSKKSHSAARSRPVRIERLEERRLMAITVTSLGDEFDGIGDGNISLREAIFSSNDGDTIDFAVKGTIQLQDQIVIDKSLTIMGPGAEFLTIRANVGAENVDGDGDRIFEISTTLSDITVTITALRFSGGDPTDYGGAILNREHLRIQDCIFTDNLANNGAYGGGAIFNDSNHLWIKSSLISGNRTTGVGGGGIYNFGGRVFINDTVIRGNSATGNGGALLSRGGEVNITNSTIAFNSALQGGGIQLSGGSLITTNTTISGNRADQDGGGVWLQLDWLERATFKFTTIADNRADANNDGTGDGGGILVFPLNETPELNHTIVASNYKGEGAAQPSDVVGSWFGNFFLVNVDAKLGPLLANGSRILTHALLPGSPAIDSGDPSAVAGVDPIPATDARGTSFSRVVDGDAIGGPRIDIGAFELRPSAAALSLVVDTLVDADDGDYSAGKLSLREAVRLANENHGFADTITFAPVLTGGTIQLVYGELAITDSLTLIGPGMGLLVIDASVSDLSSGAGDGARIFNVDDGNRDYKSTVKIEGLTLVGGDTFSGGGAIRNSEDLTVSKSEIKGNSAVADGGGILGLSGNLNVVDSIISGNESHKEYATYGGGGGIATFSYLKLASSAVFGNVSAGHGGGIFAADGKLNVTNSTISGNSSGAGGASQYQEGGGIFIGKGMDTAPGDVTISHSTITDNTSPATGAGIFVEPAVGATFDVSHTIVAGNNGPDTNNYGLAFAFSLVGVDPQLGPLGYHDSVTPTHAPLPGSPAINGGDSSLQAGVDGVPEYDQRGGSHTRVYGSRIDIGSHETQAPAVTGDANGDNIVDAADYTVWRNHFGENVGSYGSGDLNGDGLVNQADYGVWKSHFGDTLDDMGAASGQQAQLAAGSASVTSADDEPTTERQIAFVANDVAYSAPEATDSVSFSTVVAPVDAGIARAWATLPETRGRETDVRARRERHSRAGAVAPHVRDMLLASIGLEERRAGRCWQADEPAGADCGPVDDSVVDSAIGSLAQDARPPGLFGRQYRLRL